MLKEALKNGSEREIKPQYLDFEGIKIQWNKIPWNFEHPQKGKISIDTYSIWNRENHEEIAERLAAGERCALYMMGNFGVAELRDGKVNGRDPMFEDVKQRDKMQSLVIFANPSEIAPFIDFERLPEDFKELEKEEKRHSLYPGPMHAIFPIKPENLPDLGFIRPEKSASFFWMPGHTGYEELGKKVKEKTKGVLAGGSLNIHGQEPSYTTKDLKLQFERLAKWQENINFVIFDEISEYSMIGRSHTQVSFLEDPAEVVRLGSLSLERIEEHTGKRIVKNGAKLASSIRPYDDLSNEITEQKVAEALQRMARFEDRVKGL